MLRGREHYTNRIHRDDAAGLIRTCSFIRIRRRSISASTTTAPRKRSLRPLAKETGGPPPALPDEHAGPSDRRREVGSKRCSNALARESGYRFRYPTYRDGYGELIRAAAAD